MNSAALEYSGSDLRRAKTRERLGNVAGLRMFLQLCYAASTYTLSCAELDPVSIERPPGRSRSFREASAHIRFDTGVLANAVEVALRNKHQGSAVTEPADKLKVRRRPLNIDRRIFTASGGVTTGANFFLALSPSGSAEQESKMLGRRMLHVSPALALSSLRQSVCAAVQTVRTAHTYSRQDRGLYGGAHIQFGNTVSENKNKTRRRFLPNVHWHSLPSRTLSRPIRIRIATHVMRTIRKYGGIDGYLTSDSKGIQRTLGARGHALRAEILAARQLKSDEKVLRPQNAGLSPE